MIKRNIRFTGGICGALAFATIAFSQTPLQTPTSLQAHVVFSIPECGPAGATAPQVGTDVTGTVSLTPDARYQVRLTVRSRWIAGCREVGGLNIPVFGNIILSNDDVVVIGEVLPIMIHDGSRVAPIKVEVILTQEKQLGYNRTLWTRFAPARG